MNKINQYNQKQIKTAAQQSSSQSEKEIPEMKPGDLVRVHQKIEEGDKQRIQVFEGLVIAKKHGKGINATITVRRTSSGGIGVERIFPIHAPFIEKIEIVKRHKVRRAKLYYIREKSAKQARLKEIPIKNKQTPKEQTAKKTETKKIPTQGRNAGSKDIEEKSEQKEKK